MTRAHASVSHARLSVIHSSARGDKNYGQTRTAYIRTGDTRKLNPRINHARAIDQPSPRPFFHRSLALAPFSLPFSLGYAAARLSLGRAPRIHPSRWAYSAGGSNAGVGAINMDGIEKFNQYIKLSYGIVFVRIPDWYFQHCRRARYRYMRRYTRSFRRFFLPYPLPRASPLPLAFRMHLIPGQPSLLLLRATILPRGHAWYDFSRSTATRV